MKIYKEVRAIEGYTFFEDFAEEFDSSIIYADEDLDTLLAEMEYDNCEKALYYFDGWYVAVRADSNFKAVVLGTRTI